LMSDPPSLVLSDYTPGSEPLVTTMSALDYYRQVAPGVNNSAVQLFIASVADSTCSYISGIARMTGKAIGTTKNGQALMKDFGITCNPRGSVNLTSTLTFPTTSVEFPVYNNLSFWSRLAYDSPVRTMSRRLDVSFRHCHRGEYFDFFSTKSKCLPCGYYDYPNSYSFGSNDDNSIVECLNCPSQAKTCFADQIILFPGTWRWNKDASNIFTCKCRSSIVTIFYYFP